MINFFKSLIKRKKETKQEVKELTPVKECFKVYCKENPWAVECRIYEV